MELLDGALGDAVMPGERPPRSRRPARRPRAVSPASGLRPARGLQPVRRLWVAAVVLSLTAAGCSGEAQAPSPDTAGDGGLVVPDGALNLGISPDSGAAEGGAEPAPDSVASGDTAPDATQDTGPDAVGPKNTPPVFAPLPPATVRMG